VNTTKFVWSMELKNVCFLVWMMKKLGSSHEKVKLEMYGIYCLRWIFRICSMQDILSVVTSLVDLYVINSHKLVAD
jgi:hypothetical protein